MGYGADCLTLAPGLAVIACVRRLLEFVDGGGSRVIIICVVIGCGLLLEALHDGCRGRRLLSLGDDYQTGPIDSASWIGKGKGREGVAEENRQEQKGLCCDMHRKR